MTLNKVSATGFLCGFSVSSIKGGSFYLISEEIISLTKLRNKEASSALLLFAPSRELNIDRSTGGTGEFLFSCPFFTGWTGGCYGLLSLVLTGAQEGQE